VVTHGRRGNTKNSSRSSRHIARLDRVKELRIK